MLLAPGDCGAQQPFRSPVIEEVVLDNGCRVLFQSTSYSSTVAISALVAVPAYGESRLRAGTRNLLALIASAPQPWPKDIRPCRTSLRLDSSVTRDYLELLVQCLPSDLGCALALIRHRLFEAEINRESFETARRQLRSTIRTNRGLPIPLTLSTAVEELYPRRAGSWPVTGSIASMSVITLNDVREFYHNNLWPNATIISISGNVEFTEVRAKAQEYFADLLPGPGYGPEVFSPLPTIDRPRRLKMSGLDKSVVVIAGRAPAIGDSSYPAAVVLSTLLGSGMGSRLFQVLRANQSLAYTVEAALTPSQVCSHSWVLATCSRSKIDMVYAETKGQLNDIARHKPSDAELERAKRFVINSFVLSQQRNRDLSHYLGVFRSCGGMDGFYTYQQFPQLIAEVTGEQISEACAEIFHRSATVIIEAGQKSTVQSWLPWQGYAWTCRYAQPSGHQHNSSVARGDQL